jgi:hypothetical protein
VEQFSLNGECGSSDSPSGQCPGETKMINEPEVLVGLSDDELEALADSLLVPSAQTRLDKLLARNSVGLLDSEERKELDRLLARFDQLTILKTRAQYTLFQR